MGQSDGGAVRKGKEQLVSCYWEEAELACVFRTHRNFFRMSNRELVMAMVAKMPEDTPLSEIAREIEFLAGVRAARTQAHRGEGVPVEDARKLIDAWASR